MWCVCTTCTESEEIIMATKKAFKPCEGCPSPAKCKAAGKCLAKEGKGGKGALVIMVGVGKPMKAKKK